MLTLGYGVITMYAIQSIAAMKMGGTRLGVGDMLAMDMGGPDRYVSRQVTRPLSHATIVKHSGGHRLQLFYVKQHQFGEAVTAFYTAINESGPAGLYRQSPLNPYNLDVGQPTVMVVEIEDEPVPSRGLGDTIANITSAIGIPPCMGCHERRKILNKVVPYKKHPNLTQSNEAV